MDTIKKGRRVDRIVQLLIDKINHLPVYYRSEQQGFIDGTDMFIETYAEVYFYDYQVNQNDFVDLSLFVIPPSFSIEKTRTKYLLPNGSKAPDLDLTYSNGDPFLLKKQKGKVVLLNFTATSCPHGMESINMLNNLYSKYKAEHFIIVTIHPEDDKEAVERYNKKGNVQYPLFLNTAPHVADKYNIENYPTFYLVDKRGNIIKVFTGYYDALDQELNDLIKRHL